MDGGLGIGWWEEETDLNVIKNFSNLSKALGLQKSFSTGDIVSLDDSGLPVHNSGMLSILTISFCPFLRLTVYLYT